MLQGAIAGLAAGGLYAVIAVCMVLMYRLVRVVNFAQTAVGMFGAFTAVAVHTALEVPAPLALLVGLVVGAGVSALIGVIVATWLADADVAVKSAASVAALLILIALAFVLFGTKPLPFTPVLSGPAFEVGEVVITQVTLVLLATALLVASGTALLLSRTMIGVRLRALSERPIAAEMLGIRSRRLTVLTWTVAGLIATITVSIVAPIQSNNATSLALLVIPGAAAALVGGFRRLDLAVVGGIGLGMLDGALSPMPDLVLLRYFLPFAVILAVLVWMQRKEVWDVAR